MSKTSELTEVYTDTAPSLRGYFKSDVDKLVMQLEAELAEAQAEIERFNNLFKNGIECFMTPCNAHSGENTKPFDEFIDRYGRKCVVCLVDEDERKNALIEQMRGALKACEEKICHGVWSDGNDPEPMHKLLAALEAAERGE